MRFFRSESDKPTPKKNLRGLRAGTRVAMQMPEKRSPSRGVDPYNCGGFDRHRDWTRLPKR